MGEFIPRIDVVEDERGLKVSAELPGMEEKDVEVTLNRDLLTLRGTRESEKEEKTQRYHRKEQRYGSFERIIRVPFEVISDQVEARFKNGLLTVFLPKTEQAKAGTRKIAITSK